ncbi:hypothetical protein BY458DRAFT_518263 [Sporodiniella umbellata]|nr:hypothetical protein BY458DRAFT_518263 [Sporodiniella umbellata]
MKYVFILLMIIPWIWAEDYQAYDFQGIEIRNTQPLHDGLDYLMEQKREAEEEQVQEERRQRRQAKRQSIE